MRYVCVIALLLTVCHGDKLDRTYLLPKPSTTAGGSANFLEAPIEGGYPRLRPFGFAPTSSHSSSAGFESFSQNHGSSFVNVKTPPKEEIPILSYVNENHGDGNYFYSYETGNGIKAEETGRHHESQSAEGSYSYTSPEGIHFVVTYISDENGFQPKGDHLPTPPPIPDYILKSIEQNEKEAAANNGQYDDGSYKETYLSEASSSGSSRKTYKDNNGYHY